MEETIRGSLGAASAFQMTEDMDALDKQSKKILRYREVLAIILKETVEEYEAYSVDEIKEFIEADSITEESEVSNGRTNTRIAGMTTEFAELGEKTSNFDIAFRAKNPRLSGGEVVVNLYIDIEPQRNYRSGYPIEKRGIYYLSRRLCSQLDVITEKTDYGQLEKCYSIWICRERIPKEEQMSISFYKMVNHKNVGNCHPKEADYDLMTLVIIRLGDKDYHNEEKNVLDFLTMIFYPHSDGFREKVSKYISFEEVLGEEEEENMIGLGYCFYATGMEEGIEQGIEQGAELKLCLLVCRKLAKGKTIPEIAEALDEPEDVIQALCEKAEVYAPEYDEEKIKENWRSAHV